MINEDVRYMIEAELGEGEEVLWTDRPDGLYISTSALYGLVISIFWVGITALLFGGGVFAIFTDDGNPDNAMLSFYRNSADFRNIFWLMTVTFTGVSVYLVLYTSYLLISPSREKYAVTNLRGIIIRPFIRYRIINLSPDQLKSFERTGGPDYGTLTFKSKIKTVLSLLTKSHQKDVTAFHKIRNPKQVENLIYKTFKDQNHE